MKLVGERRALAAIVMAFYFLVYGVMAVQQVQPEFTKAFVAIAGVYGLAFFSLVAGYFWARWYAVGVGLYGVITAAVGMWQIGAEPVLLFIGGTHLAATVFLWGQAMSGPYDGQAAWREKFHMDEALLGKTVGDVFTESELGLSFLMSNAQQLFDWDLLEQSGPPEVQPGDELSEDEFMDFCTEVAEAFYPKK